MFALRKEQQKKRIAKRLEREKMLNTHTHTHTHTAHLQSYIFPRYSSMPFDFDTPFPFMYSHSRQITFVLDRHTSWGEEFHRTEVAAEAGGNTHVRIIYKFI
jgi:hypothetical protein